MTLQALPGWPEVQAGDDLVDFIHASAQAAEWAWAAGDILVIAHKVVSKAEDRVVDLRTVQPGAEAQRLAAEVGKDAAKVELILQESRAIIRVKPPLAGRESVLICEHRLGWIMANAGIDESNVGAQQCVLLPLDPDHSARRLRSGLQSRCGGPAPGIIISDTFGRPWRRGLVNVAIGLAGVPAVVDLTDQCDAHGRPLRATIPAFADEVAAAAGLLMAKAGGCPAVVVRGLAWQESNESARDIIRPVAEDLFR